jgi:AraC-like DNA-binding protein
LAHGQELAASIPASTSAVLNVRIGRGSHSRLSVGGRTTVSAYGVGEGSLIAPGTDTRWSLQNDPEGGWFNVIFDQHLLRLLSESGGAPIRTMYHVADASITALAHMFFDLAGDEDKPDPLLWQSLGHVLLWRLAALGAEKEVAVAVPRGGLAPWQAKRTTEYLADNVAQRVTLDELAAIARLSPFHFARAFARTLGMPPHRYHRKLKVERACQLLATTDMRVIEVALAVGYETSQALARIFVQYHGMTPSEWRRRHACG